MFRNRNPKSKYYKIQIKSQFQNPNKDNFGIGILNLIWFLDFEVGIFHSCKAFIKRFI